MLIGKDGQKDNLGIPAIRFQDSWQINEPYTKHRTTVLPIPAPLFLIHLTYCGKLLCLNKKQLKANLQTIISKQLNQLSMIVTP